MYAEGEGTRNFAQPVGRESRDSNSTLDGMIEAPTKGRSVRRKLQRRTCYRLGCCHNRVVPMKGDTFEEESLNNNRNGVDDKKSVGDDHLSLTAN
jgi:hypothetical protein